MKGFIITVVVLAALLAGADVLARIGTERAIEHAVAEQVDVETVDVTLSGFPILYHILVADGVPEVRFDLTELVVGDPPISLGRVDAVLNDVDVPIRHIVSGTAPEIAVGDGGTFDVAVDEAALQQLVDRESPGWTVTVAPDGVRASGEVLGVTVEAVADLRVEAGALVLATREITAGALGIEATAEVAGALDFSVDLGPLPFGLVFDEAELRSGVVVLRGVIPPGTVFRR